MSCDINSLLASNPCFAELSERAQQAVIAALLCQISTSGGGGGSGTVTGFSSGNGDILFTTSVATATTTPALSFAFNTQNANLIYAGPTSGGAATPTFRALVVNDFNGGTGASNTTFWRGDGTWATPAGSGTVTSFSAGNLSPLFTTSVATATSTPALTFSLSNAAANTVFGNATTGSAAPGFTSSPSCIRFLEVVSAIGGTSIDWSVASMFTFTVSANVIFTFANITAGQAIKVAITGDASHTVTWPTVKWPGGVAPTQTLSKLDTYTFISFDGTTVEGSAVQNQS